MQRITVGLVLVIFFSFATYFSGKHALANTYVHSALQAISVNRRDISPSEQQIASASIQISKALLLTPKDPDTLDLAGRIWYLDAISTTAEARRRGLLQQAGKFHSDALTTRNYWPYSHVNMVYVKSALGEFDTDYANHFKRAYQLGFDDRSVIRDLLYLGINDWNQQSQQLRELTTSTAQRALQQKIVSPRGFRPYLESQNQLFRLCGQLPQFQEKIELCNS
ncbi:MAG: hypothetical protein RLN82_03865 [Pseudomonadales bacterium]